MHGVLKYLSETDSRGEKRVRLCNGNVCKLVLLKECELLFHL